MPHKKKAVQDPRIAALVIEMVATYYKTTPEALKSEEGNRTARQVVMHILKEELGASINTAIEAINVKSAPTLYAAVKAVKALQRTDPALAALIEEVKSEVLMLTTTGTARGSTPAPKPGPVLEQTQASNDSNNEATKTICAVQNAVSTVFLGADLLQSADPATTVLLAKDAVVFLIWSDFPTVPLADTLSAFRIDRDGFYRAVGRVSVTMKEDGGEIQQKLEAARKAYQRK